MGLVKHKWYRFVLCTTVIASLVVCYLKQQSLSNSKGKKANLLAFQSDTIIALAQMKNNQCKFACCIFVGPMSEHTLEYFLNKGTIQRKDAADIEWYHAANSKSKLEEALTLQGEYKYEEQYYSTSLRNNVLYDDVFSLVFIEVLHR